MLTLNNLDESIPNRICGRPMVWVRHRTHSNSIASPSQQEGNGLLRPMQTSLTKPDTPPLAATRVGGACQPISAITPIGILPVALGL